MLKSKKIKGNLTKLGFLFYVIIVLLSVSNVYSNLQNIHDVYGLYNAVKYDFKHLSPFHGFLFIEKNITRNFYEYGPKNDPITELVRDLFRLEGDAFKGTTRRDHIGQYLDSTIIGQILFAIEEDRDKESLGNKFVVLIEKYIKEKLSASNIRRAFGSTGKFNTEINNFSDKLINALSSTNYFSKEELVYPDYTFHYIILSFLYAKINDKKDLKTYFDQFKKLDNGSGILKDINLLEDSYPKNSQLIIMGAFESQPKEQLWDYVIKNYEPLGFAIVAMEKFGGEYPTYLSYRTVLPEWFKDIANAENYAYSDCMETALRNLLNFTFYVSREFILPEIIDKGSIGAKFYEEYAIGEISGRKAHDRWATIISNIPGVFYLNRSKIDNSKIVIEKIRENLPKPQEDDGWYYYELKPSLSNIWKIANHVFNLNLKNFGDFLIAFHLECAEEIEETKTQLECKITEKNRRDCTLNIWPKHGEVLGFKAEKIGSSEIQEIFRDKLFAQSFKNFELVINIFGFDLLDPEHFHGLRIILPELENKGHELLNSGYFRYILMTQFLTDNQTKILLVEFLLREIQNRPKTDWYIAFLKLLVNSLLKLNDAHTTESILDTLAKYSKDGLIQWTKELIEEQVKNVKSDYIGTIVSLISNWRCAHIVDWVTNEWLASLLEKANPHAFFRTFINFPFSALELIEINNLKDLIEKNFYVSDVDSNTALLAQFLNTIVRLLNSFGSDWVKNLIEVHKAKLDDTQKSMLLEGILYHSNAFDSNWVKNLISEVKQPSDSLKAIVYRMWDFLGTERIQELRTKWEKREELEEEVYPDESEEEFSEEEFSEEEIED